MDSLYSSILYTCHDLAIAGGGGGNFEGLLGGNSGGGPSCFCANNFFARFFANKHLFVLHYYIYFVLLNLTKFEYQ